MHVVMDVVILQVNRAVFAVVAWSVVSPVVDDDACGAPGGSLGVVMVVDVVSFEDAEAGGVDSFDFDAVADQVVLGVDLADEGAV